MSSTAGAIGSRGAGPWGEQGALGHARGHVHLEAAGRAAVPDEVDAPEVAAAVGAVDFQRPLDFPRMAWASTALEKATRRARGRTPTASSAMRAAA